MPIFCLTVLMFTSWECRARRAEQPQETIQKAPNGVQAVPKFSGKSAFGYLVAQTNFGPRIANSVGHQNCLDYLERELRENADTVVLQPFTHTGYDGTTLHFTNIIASFNLLAEKRIMLCAHWDSRPWADEDPNPKNRTKPIAGANDGASGVAVLLEIARHLKEHPPATGLDMVLFDGEDYGKAHDLDNFLLGSKYYARNKPPPLIPEFGILVDMVGDAQLEIPKERNSMAYAPDIVRKVWSAALEVGSTAFIDAEGEALHDDHVPLNQAGIKTIDIIDFNYPDQSQRFWHTLEDTPDKCSAESLEEVGKVLLQVIYRHSP